jgi:hypothetical protein
MRIREKLSVAAGTAVTVLAVCTTLVTASAQAVSPTVVASGLLNPRGLAFAPNGTLYVAEAGSGGPTVFGDAHVGVTSRISAINLGGSLPAAANPVVTGLISIATPDGTLGASGLSIQGGRILASIAEHHQLVDGLPPTPLVNAAEAQLGRLIQANPGGQWKSIADVGGFDYEYTQACINLEVITPPCGADGQSNTAPGEFPDANPYGILAMPGKTYVADAGANTLDLVKANGSIQILAYAHAQANDFLGDEVPTCVAQAGGQLYVGTLNGNVFRYNGTSTLQPVLLRPNFATPPIGISACVGDAAGNLYLADQAAEFLGAPTGVYKMAPDGSITLLAAVPDPSGITIGPDGNLYVSQNSTSTDGQVVRLLP